MPLKALIFDMDGTLIDSLPYMLQAFNETFLRFSGKSYTNEALLALFGPSEPGLIKQLVPQASAEQAVQFYFERYRALHPPVSTPFPGVFELLGDLRAWGIRSGVVTGKSAPSAAISMEVYGLTPYFDDLLTGSDTGGEKPTAIRAMLDKWRIDPCEAAYVGDLPSDMAAARQAGVTAIGAGWSGGLPVDADELIFPSISALRAWIKSKIDA